MKFNRAFEPNHGIAVPIGPGIQRLTAKNPSPFTFLGTNTYIVGERQVALIDPGPDDKDHLKAIVNALDGRKLTHIFVTHTHKDHSPLARRLQEETGALVLAEGPHRLSRPLSNGEINEFSESSDLDFRPDVVLRHDDVITGDGWALRTVLTPGHAANHAAFAIEDQGILFCGDHVMAWSTTVVAPPDGSMKDYMASLNRLILRNDHLLLPGHGGVIEQPRTFMRALKAHRQMREKAIFQRLQAGDRFIADIVAALYADVDPHLHPAAAFSVLAHLESLVQDRLVYCEGPLSLQAKFQPV
ncbi:MBL fold metallo-hydrolase [Oryzifoliimicrobium ureilyticus]|uniref:MBL fold metallo-hydrolase n=1 Tax=Oryzifoliimicrobium ureilyticus TaxID=3113724 RepID=UPI0030765FC7